MYHDIGQIANLSNYLYFRDMQQKPVQNDLSQKDRKLALKTNYCFMQVKIIAECQGHSAIFSTFIKLRFVIKIDVLSIFEWPF